MAERVRVSAHVLVRLEKSALASELVPVPVCVIAVVIAPALVLELALALVLVLVLVLVFVLVFVLVPVLYNMASCTWPAYLQLAGMVFAVVHTDLWAMGMGWDTCCRKNHICPALHAVSCCFA